MKTLIFLLMITMVLLCTALAQSPVPANFHIIYGNRDGSPMVVHLGSLIQVPIWGATDPTPGNPDTVSFMHDPLACNGAYIFTLNGGFGATHCDTISLHYANMIIHMRFPDLIYPDISCLLYTLGDTVLLATFRMTTSSNPSLIGQTVCPFTQGYNPQSGGLLWGMIDGLNGVVPTQTYGCLYFTDCEYLSGDVNNDGIFNGIDVVYFVNYLKGGLPPPIQCYCGSLGVAYPATDINGNCQFNGIDVTYAVHYLKGLGSPPRRCPNCG
jgi:hypothetical protein